MKNKMTADHQDSQPPSEDPGPARSKPLAMGIELIDPSSALSQQLNQFKKNPTIVKVKIQHSKSNLIISQQSESFRNKFFPYATSSEWNDWHWQLSHRIQDGDTLARILRLSPDELSGLTAQNKPIPFSITPYYASLLDPDNPDHPLRRSVVPVTDEFLYVKEEMADPLGEDHDSPVPGIVHRYPDRVLFLATGFCSTYCRYCTRSRMVGKEKNCLVSFAYWEKAIQYIESTPVVRDVLLSGGDPLTLSTERLEWLIARIRRIPHVEVIRIGTKVPAVLPQRITTNLVNMLKKYHPLWMNIHFTHPEEITPEVKEALGRLADAGIPLGSQTVLLKGVNDSVDTMKQLMHGLVRNRVRPYYIYQCDLVPGTSHFRTSVEKGLEIIQGLRGHTSGFAVPTFVIDAPAGGGKIPLLPEYVLGKQGSHVVLRNYEGNIYTYPDTESGTVPVNSLHCVPEMR